MEPIISIIIPCYNSAKYIKETLDCLLKQTIVEWECVIVNDGSTDDSLSILREYEKQDARFKVINKENGGPASARNTAIAHSLGKYILPLDSDDIIAPSFAEKAIKYLEDHSDIKLVYSLCQFFGDRSGLFYTEEYKYENILWNNCIVCTAVFRRSDFDKTLGYNANMNAVYEDWDFWLSLLEEGDNVYRIPEVLFYYRVHGVSRSAKSNEIYKQAQRTIVKNHPDKYLPFMEDIITYYNESRGFYAISNSKAFMVGYKLCQPIKVLKVVINKIKNRFNWN